MTCDVIFSHLVVFTAPDGSLAVEPVTHATDGFNLMARGVEGTGVKVLEPGEMVAGTVTLSVRQGEG
jgi:aldose 1-epimerase